MRIFSLLTPILISAGLYACTQKSTTGKYKEGYHIDKSVEDDAKRKIKGNECDISTEWVENGKVTENMLSGKSSPHFASCAALSDTFKITLMHVMYPSGIRITIHKDSAWAIHFVSPKDKSLKSFKKNPADTVYQYSPDAAAEQFVLVLDQPPVKGKPVYGYARFKSKEFFEKDGAARRFNLEGYFRIAACR